MGWILSTFTVFSWAAFVAVPSLESEADPSSERIEKARDAYRSAVAKVQREIDAKLQAKIDSARKRGDRDAVVSSTKERQNLAGGVLPKDLLTEEHCRQLKEAINKAMDAFDQAIRKYTRENQDGKAEKVESEKQGFVKESGAIAAIVFPPEEKDPKAKTGKGKPAEPETIDAWGRWEKYSSTGGPRCVLWQDENGWHLRALTGGRPKVFQGTIQVEGGQLRVENRQGLKNERRGKDEVLVNSSSDQISFSLRCGVEKGFDFRLTNNAKKLHCTAKTDNLDHPEWIFIGGQGQNPKDSKFILQLKRTAAK